MHEQQYIYTRVRPGTMQLPVGGGRGARVCAGCCEGGEGARGPCPARQLPEALGTEGRSHSRGLASEPAVDASLNMGCSLCSLRKPEEQYRLLYEVCQVTVAFSSVQWTGAPLAEGTSRGRNERSWCMFVF